MPELTTHATWTCSTNESWETTVTGSKGDEYTVRWGLFDLRDQNRFGSQYGWSCTCKGFEHHRKCKHIEFVNASGERCAWNDILDVGVEASRDDNDEPCCPECGAPVVAYNVAV